MGMAKLVVIGSGIVGQATGKGLIAKGHQVVFSDLNPEVLAKLRDEGHTVCPPELLGQEETDVLAFFLAISTPTVDGRIELGFLESAVANLGNVLKSHEHYSIVVIRSTVPPNTTRGSLVPLLEKYSGKKAGEDFGVCMNPEYLRESSNEQDFKNPWLVMIGELDTRSGQALEAIYGQCNCPIFHLPLEEAEMQKYIHNLWNACKISFFNEMRGLCDQIGKEAGIVMDADKIFWITMESAEASWNLKYGIRNLGPFGGTCLPKDTNAFLAWAKDRFGKTLVLLKAVIAVNDDLVRQR